MSIGQSRQLRKDTKEELKIIERSLKRTTSPDCPYEISDSTTKKFLRVRQDCNLVERIVLQAEMNEYKEEFFHRDAVSGWPGAIERRIFTPDDDARRFFNQFMFKLFASKREPRKVVGKAIEKIDKIKRKIKKRFSEISHREEFYFDKLTAQILQQYQKSLKPYEYKALELLFDFQDNLRLFNWNVVDKDAQLEYLFRVVQLLQIKDNLLATPEEKTRFHLPASRPGTGGDGGDEHPAVFELLYIIDRLHAIRGKIISIDRKMFGQGLGLNEKTTGKKLTPEQGVFLRKYLDQLHKLNTLAQRFKDATNDPDLATDDPATTGLVEELKQHVEGLLKQLVPGQEVDLDEKYRHELVLVNLVVKLFGKLFWMLKRKRTMSDLYVIKRLLSEIAGKEKNKLAILLGMVFFNAVVGMITPLIFQYLVDYGLGDLPDIEASWSVITNAGLFFLVFSGTSTCFHIVTNYLIHYLANKTMYSMRARMFANLQQLSFDYYNSQPAGKIISYITNDVETIQQLVSQGFLTIFIQIFQLVGSIFFMFYISWQLSLVAFMIIPFLAVLGIFVFGKARQYFVTMRNKIAAVTTHTQESIAGMRVIEAFAIEEKDASTFRRATSEELEINLKAARLFAALPGGIIAVISLGMMVLILLGGWLYTQSLIFPPANPADAFTRGRLFSFIIYLIQFIGPVVGVMGFTSQLQNSMAAGERIIRLVDAQSSVQEKRHSIGIGSPEFAGLNKDTIRLKFENVSFEYEKGIQVLKNMTLKARPKERLALVGYTGAGKTTFISLLSRFWDPTSGRILINDVDIRHFKLDALRQLMGVVLQDNYLFSGSVMDNIKFGKPSATDEEVFEITRKLGIHEFIQNMEKGYDTPVRERGSRLSLGQKQLISFARALLVDPPILILDEATSAIDPYSEIIVKNALDVLLKDRTSITIAHRLSTVLNSDRILVIDDGKIVEEGNHEKLLKKKGLYNHLYELQYTKLKKGK
ncbi:MAG: ABC transporter ATP-binding protein [Candidatus Lokiarchaeota archaeon]|nr:ABC transporter ATP-binding protein [Candidatus Lokiarchaeota archaeon]